MIKFTISHLFSLSSIEIDSDISTNTFLNKQKGIKNINENSLDYFNI